MTRLLRRIHLLLMALRERRLLRCIAEFERKQPSLVRELALESFARALVQLREERALLFVEMGREYCITGRKP